MIERQPVNPAPQGDAGRLQRHSRGCAAPGEAASPQDREESFGLVARELETAYVMVGVALDIAFELRENGQLWAAREQARCAAELLDRFQERMLATLDALKEFASLAQVADKDNLYHSMVSPDRFRHGESRRLAVWHFFVHWMQYSQRLRFLHTLQAMREMLLELASQFRESAFDLADGTCVHPFEFWNSLEVLHSDLQICQQEVVVAAHSLFLALSEERAMALRRRLVPAA